MAQALALSNEDLFRAAPAIFAEKPFLGLSEQYKFIPTIDVVETMRDNGFFPVLASQSHTRCIAKQGMQRHMIKFRQEQYIGEPAIVGKEVPEIVLINSHDGSSLYELMMGIFRFVCGNGMVVQSADFGSYSVKHNGMIADLIEKTYEIVADFPRAFEQIETMKTTMLPKQRQLFFAEQALKIKKPVAFSSKQNSTDQLKASFEHGLVVDNVSSNDVAPGLLIEAKREDDMPDSEGNRDLWTTFNVVQEHLIKGGIQGKSVRQVEGRPVERKTKTLPIRSIQENIRMNQELWDTAVKMAA